MIRNCFKYLFFIFAFSLFSCSKGIASEDLNKLYLAAVDAYSSEKYMEALKYIEVIQKNDKSFYQAVFLKGKILFFQNDYLNSVKIFRNLVKKYSQFSEARIWYIRTLILMENFSEAQDILDKELSFNQTDWRIYYLYSVLEDAKNNIDKKIIMLNRAELALTDSAKVYMELSDVWSILDLQEKSKDYLLKSKIITGSNASLSSLQNSMLNKKEAKK